MALRDLIHTPPPPDTLAASTVLHLNGDDVANGSQNNTFVDSSSNNHAITRYGNTTQGSFSPFAKEAGKWSNYFGGSGDYLLLPKIGRAHV